MKKKTVKLLGRGRWEWTSAAKDLPTFYNEENEQYKHKLRKKNRGVRED